MSYGPIELIVLKFPGNKFSGEILPALQELVENRTIRIVDIIFIHKDADGRLKVLEIDDLEDEVRGSFNLVIADLTGLLSTEDGEQLGAKLEANSSAAVMLFENTWATRFADALHKANAELIMSERIPRAVIEELVAAQAAA